MIKTILIQNFRSHKETKLELDKGINIIVGSSSGGKTNVIRALNWVINNRPSGDSYRNRQGGDTEVSVELETNSIQRIKNKKDNLYKLGNAEYKAMGTDIPEDIKTLLNFTDINLQNQHNAPFLLSESAGEVGRYLNKLVNLDLIDVSMRKIATKKRELSTDYKHFLSELDTTTEQQKKYSWVKEAEEKIIELSRIETAIQNNRNNSDLLTRIITGIKRVSEEIEELKHVEGVEGKINELEKLQAKITLIERESNSISKIINEIKWVEKNIVAQKSLIDISEKQFKELMPKICPLCGK